MYLTMLILPLLGSFVSGFLGRKLGIQGSQIVSTLCVVITTLLAIIVFTEVSYSHLPVSLHLFRWIDSESLMVNWGFNFDSLTVSMLIPVLIVSSLVHIYSIGYMSQDPHNQRFFSYLSLFTFMMLILVTSNNYLLMFVGWEGVGVCSYLLVSFWFTRIAANQSSLAAFLTNRVGDCFLTIGMFALLLTFGNINYSTIFSLSPYISENIITLIGVLLLLGAMAKSSQIGLHVWLPMAMEGPTPVSALIHAATMVTAGVYLLMRSSPLIEYSSTVLLLCLWIGAITTVFSSLIGLFQQDIKKVIAYSTMSQLGMMVIAVGLSSYNLALFHLVNHAFYKALLFLGAGSVIHAVADNQDFRKYGGLKAFLPLTYSVMLIASLSLVAFPFMTGFYSKDFILESAYGNFSFSTTSVYFIATIGAMFTTLYSVKVLYLTFLTNPNGPQSSYKLAHEGDIYMSLPLIILAIFSIVFGYVTKDLFIGLGSDVFSDNSIFIHPNHEITLDTEFAVPVLFKLLPLIFTVSLSLIYIIFSEFTRLHVNTLINFKFSRFGYNFYSFFNQRFLIEAFYNKYITDFVLKIGGITTKVIDKGLIELIGPYGLEKALYVLGNIIENLSTKRVTTYALYILVGLVFYITCYYNLDGDNSLNIMVLIPLIITNNSLLLNSNYNNLSYSKSHFSTSSVLQMDDNNNSWNSPEREEGINANDGTKLDSTYEISETLKTREAIDAYFVQKETSMTVVLRNGTYTRTEEDHVEDIRYLAQQRYDALDQQGLITPADEAIMDNIDAENQRRAAQLYDVPPAYTATDANPPANNNPATNANPPANNDPATNVNPPACTNPAANPPANDLPPSYESLFPPVDNDNNTEETQADDDTESSLDSHVTASEINEENSTETANNEENNVVENTNKRKRDDSSDNSDKELEVGPSNKRKREDSPDNSDKELEVGPSNKRKRDDSPDTSDKEENVVFENSNKRKREDSLEDTDTNPNKRIKLDDNENNTDNENNSDNEKNSDNGSNDAPDKGNGSNDSNGSDNGNGSSKGNGSDKGNGPNDGPDTGNGPDSGNVPPSSGGESGGSNSGTSGGSNNTNSRSLDDNLSTDSQNDTILDNSELPTLVSTLGHSLSNCFSTVSQYMSINIQETFIVQKIQIVSDLIPALTLTGIF